ncbi:MAG: hypothetical protein HQL78_07225 [Magnetococcales bacterium]|nr:hypothetical protein [Magnetococcales bacterium]
MNTPLNRFKASVVLAIAFCSFFTVLFVIVGDPMILNVIKAWQLAAFIVVGSLTSATMITGYLTFLDKNRH